MPTILVVDDDPVTANVIADHLRRESCEVKLAFSGAEALRLAREIVPDLVFLDVVMPELDGIQVLKSLKAEYPLLAVVMLTAFSTVDKAVEAMRAGADDYVSKENLREKLLIVTRNFLKTSDLATQVTTLKTQLAESKAQALIGSSAPVQHVYELIRKAAASDITVLLAGESGTGKELIARAIHNTSPRMNRPLVTIDCAMLPESLIESELFGYERGAFTGAVSRKPGRFELAHRGTIFLDEIGNLSPSVQQKLLRFLEERRIERLGGKESVKLDVRLIAATNVDLESAVKHATFREDLFYRLNVFTIMVPPLRDRVEDIPQLVRYFLERFAMEQHKPIPRITQAVTEILSRHEWPGNIRELRNVLERAVLLADEEIQVHDLPPQLQHVVDITPTQKHRQGLRAVGQRALAHAERALILRTLEKFHWNKTKVASDLKVDYKTLYNKMKTYGIPMKP